jgi:hypothetical protein
MDVQAWPDSNVRDMALEIQSEGLIRNVAELELFGFTIVHVDQTGAADMVDEALERALDMVEKRNGIRPDVEEGGTHQDVYGRSTSKFVHVHRAFQNLMMHPKALTLVTYLLGKRAQLSTSGLFMKGPATGTGTVDDRVYFAGAGNRLQLGLHADYTQRPSPFPARHEQCNVTWLLSDYNQDNGSLALVPGSHRELRHPLSLEGEEDAVPINAKKGSFVLFTSATWHGSFPRKVKGLRTGMAFFYCRPCLARLESFEDVVTPELLEGMPDRFATLMGVDRFEFSESGVSREAASKWPAQPHHFT